MGLHLFDTMDNIQQIADAVQKGLMFHIESIRHKITQKLYRKSFWRR